MRKIIIIGLIIALAAGSSGAYFFIRHKNKQNQILAEEAAKAASATPAPYKKILPKPELVPGTENFAFAIYVETQLQKREESLEAAIDYAKKFKNASIIYKKTTEPVWDNFALYNVFYGKGQYSEFETFDEACDFASNQERAYIYFRRSHQIIWSNADPWPAAYQINDVETLYQNPELPRGCEVTSLAMLLRHRGVKVTKMELAENIKKDTTEYKRANGVTYAGNPNNGFVGDMTNLKSFGLGVYHKPIYELLRKYKPAAAMDLTGCDFDNFFSLIRTDRPIWIITNVTYAKLPDSAFETWRTPDGDIKITRKEHSVLVTGYDDNYIYFNDPLSGARASSRNEFIEAWEQMGRQAVALSE